MECGESQQLKEYWVAEHDRLCQALEEYEARMAVVPLSEFERLGRLTSAARAACDRARELLRRHELNTAVRALGYDDRVLHQIEDDA
jgi:hypothetical protein